MCSHTVQFVCIDYNGDLIGNNRSIYEVEVHPEKTVSRLQRDIKATMEPILNDVAIPEIMIWKLSNPVPIGRFISERKSFLNSINFPDSKSVAALEGDGGVQILLPGLPIKNIWPDLDKVQPEYVHMVVRVSPRDDTDVPRGIKRKRDEDDYEAVNLLKTLIEPAPSTLASSSTTFSRLTDGLVLRNRSFQYKTIPVSLLQEEFAMFKVDCLLKPTPEDVGFLMDLTMTTCKYSDEVDRHAEINSVLGRHMGLLFPRMRLPGTSRSIDGHSYPVIVIPSMIRGYSNGESDALTKAIAYYANFLGDKLSLAPYTRFPSILITDNGPLFGFYACLWSGGKIVVEPLTHVFDLTVHWTDRVARQRIMSALGALKKAFRRIEEHYKSVISVSQPIQHEFPFPSSFTDDRGVEVQFKFTERVKDKLVFEAETAEKGTRLIIKFTHQYSEDAHRILDKVGYAPKLLAVRELHDGWKMVVMVRSPFKGLHLTLGYGLDDDEELKAKSKVRKILQALHTEGFVHGDVRLANILVNEKNGDFVHLIDFDWAGKVGMATYPVGVERLNMWRPADVLGGGLITTNHDMEMLDHEFR